MKNFAYNFFVKGFIVTLPLFFLSVSTPIGGVTLDRLFLFLSFLLMVLFSFKVRVKKKLISHTFFIFLLYVSFNKLYHQEEIVSKYSLLITVILSYYVTFRYIEKGLTLDKSIDISFIIFSLIALYSLWHFISYGFVPSKFSFLDSIPFIRTVNYEHMEKINQGYTFPRISLPYPTPPQLSIVMAAYSFFYFSNYLTFTRRKRDLLFMLLGVLIMVTTISRSGIIPFFLISSIYYSISIKKNIFIKYYKLLIFVFLLIFSIKSFNKNLYSILYYRFFGSSTQQFAEGHLDARYKGLNIFLEGDSLEMLFGIGIGNFPGLHAHMTIVTFLVEIGVVGVLLYIYIFYQRIKENIIIYLKYGEKAKNHLVETMMILLVFLGMLFYEFTYVIPLYVFMGILCGKSFIEKKKLKLKK